MYLQRTVGNHAVAALIRPAPAPGFGARRPATPTAPAGRAPHAILQRAKKYDGNLSEHDAKDELPKEYGWFKFAVKADVNDTVYVRDDDSSLELFKKRYAEGTYELEDYVESADDAANDGGGGLGANIDAPKTNIDAPGGQEDLYGGPDVSSQVTFKHSTMPDRTTSVPEPDKIDGEFTKAMADRFPGTITKVMFKVPQPPRTHFEVMCEADLGGEELELIKFDFTQAGYRMIYPAKDTSDGLETRSTKELEDRVSVADAMARLLSIAAKNKGYRDTNTCGTFARELYEALAGETPQGEDDVADLLGLEGLDFL